MSVKDSSINIGDLLGMIDAKCVSATNGFHQAKGRGDTEQAETMAEVKYQMADLKMQIVDHVLREVEGR